MNTINFSFQEYQNGYLPAKENYFKNAPQTTKNKAKNYVVTQDDVIEYNQLAEQYRGGANFGFYLEFPYEPPTLTGKEDDLDDFKNLFKKTNTDLNLYDLVIRSEGNTTQRVGGQLTQESVNNLTARSISKFDSLEYISQLSFVEFGNVGKAKLPLDFSLDKVDYKTWDLTGFFLDYKKQSQTVLKNILNIANNKNVTVLGESSEAIQKYQNNTTYKFFQDLMLEAANIGFKNLVNKNSLTAKQCFIDSSETPHEILFYKIIKKDRNGNQLQTFILPSPAEESKTRRKLLNFFDAQVKYDKQYEYEINAYPLVLAKKYSYFPVLDTSRVVLSDELRFSVFFKFMSYFVVDFIKTMNFKIVGNKLNYDFKVISQVIKDYINNFPKKSKQAFQDSKSKIIFFGILAEIQLDFDNLLKKIENSLDFSKINSTSKISITELSTIKTVVAKHYFNQSIFSYRKTAAIPRDPQVGKKLSFLLGGFKYDEEVAQLFLDKFTPGTINLQGVKLKTSEAKLLTISGDFTKLEKELASLYINLNPINFDKLEAKVEDYIVLMEVPLFSIEGKVLENPPIYPEVHFSGVKGKNNQIFISLKTQTTRMYEKPIPFNDIEEDYFNNLIKSKGTDRNGRLLFKTDDENRKFQIFRLEERPKSYKDFDQQIRREIDLQGKYAGATYRDRLLPNKKYYYTFRSMDVHDNLSNPSPVYEVVVNDQAGFIFPEFKVIQLEDKDYYQYTQSFRKYLEIKPSFENTIIDTDITDNFKSAYGLGLGGVAPLGSGVDNAWGKKFKVRITSKSSGKKVDINFDFTKKYVGDVVTASDVAGYGVISEEDRTNMATLPESERPTQELGQSTPILEDSDFFKRKEE